jgi:hypothetical protein
MKLTRRNTLIGFVTAAAGAGVVTGTGAFTTAESDRGIGVETTGDLDGATIVIDADPENKYDTLDETGGGGNNKAITIDFTDLNANTIFTFDEALGVTPNADDGPYNINVDASGADGISITNGDNNAANPGGGGTGQTAKFDMKVNLKAHDASDIGDGDDTITIDITQA